MANIGLGQINQAGQTELPLLTAGEELSNLKQYLPQNQQNYNAGDVVNYLLDANS